MRIIIIFKKDIMFKILLYIIIINIYIPIYRVYYHFPPLWRSFSSKRYIKELYAKNKRDFKKVNINGNTYYFFIHHRIYTSRSAFIYDIPYKFEYKVQDTLLVFTKDSIINKKFDVKYVIPLREYMITTYLKPLKIYNDMRLIYGKT